MQSNKLPTGKKEFTLDDFKPTTESRAKICEGLNERHTEMVNLWIDQQEQVSLGNWDFLRGAVIPEKMTYDNPNRPDLGTFEEWITSPQGLYKTFPPCVYRTLDAWGKGENEIVVLCHHYGKQDGGPYMGVQPNGQEINVMWFSRVIFEGDKIVHIYSIADVFSMMVDVGVVDAPQPVDPYK